MFNPNSNPEDDKNRTSGTTPPPLLSILLTPEQRQLVELYQAVRQNEKIVAQSILTVFLNAGDRAFDHVPERGRLDDASFVSSSNQMRLTEAASSSYGGVRSLPSPPSRKKYGNDDDNDDDRNDKRQQQQQQKQRAGRLPAGMVLTETEQHVFRKRTYSNWQAGGWAGGITFVVSWALMRRGSRSSRRSSRRHGGTSNNTIPQLWTTMTSSFWRWWSLEQPQSISPLSKTAAQQQQQQQTSMSISLETMKIKTGSRVPGGSNHPPPRSSGSSSYRDYAQLDQTPAKATAMVHHPPHASSSTSSTSRVLPLSIQPEDDNTTRDLQIIISAGIGLFVSLVVAQWMKHRAGFLRDVAAVPLQSGRSHVCYYACPAVLNHVIAKQQGHDDFVLAPIYRRYFGFVTKPMTMTGTGGEEVVSQSTPPIPETEDLDAMIRLVQNCQARMAYQKTFEMQKQQREQKHEEGSNDTHCDDDDVVVNIPEPGIVLDGWEAVLPPSYGNNNKY